MLFVWRDCRSVDLPLEWLSDPAQVSVREHLCALGWNRLFHSDTETHREECVKTQSIFIREPILACDHFILAHWSFQTVLDNGSDTQAQLSLITWPSSFATTALSLPPRHTLVPSLPLSLGSVSHICLWDFIMHVYRYVTPWAQQCITVSRTVSPDSHTLTSDSTQKITRQ